ncbi:MAG: hypothetical protein ACD_26C00034G0027 [uncultured bacterium]|nr:MAG: hypothetical protein ACD_26C00034G0027 [uncultured bacterium]
MLSIKLLVTMSLFGFLCVGGLLLTNHPGFAIRIINYLFFIILIGVIYEKFIKK